MTSVDDLELPCPDCNASGYQWGPAWDAWHRRWTFGYIAALQHPFPPDVAGPLDPLEAAERAAGPRPDPDESVCATCAGMGYRLTSLGERTLAFLHRWYVGPRRLGRLPTAPPRLDPPAPRKDD